MARVVAIGIQDFAQMLENNCFYVDKTAFIEEWWSRHDAVTLITRPRRFGKTLNMSMLDYFFSNRHADRKDLFRNLKIWKNEYYQKLQGTYPVLLMSFAGVKHADFENTRRTINGMIADLFRQYEWLLDDVKFNEADREAFRKITCEMDDSTAALSLRTLSEWLYRYYGKKCIILLDEYDTPMQEAYVYGFWDDLTMYIRALFNNTFKSNPYLERAVMTGITRVSKESVFSDLNNLNVVTTTSDEYASSFGFTEEEVFAALEEQAIKALTGENSLDISIVNSMMPKHREKVEQAQRRMEEAKAKMDKEKEQSKEAQREIGDLVSWADAFDEADPETRKMIIARLVERIDIGADYSISIRFRISMKQYTGDVA